MSSLSLPTLAQRAALLLAVAVAAALLAGALLALLAAGLLLELALPQPARNAAATAPAAQTRAALGTLHPLADMPAACKTPAPAASPAPGEGQRARAAQRFVVEVAVRRGARERRISAAGRDIYAVTGPLVAEAAGRLLDGRARVRGAGAPGEVFDAPDFLDALSPRHLRLSRSEGGAHGAGQRDRMGGI